jgi:hypothetical protein
MKVPSWRQKMKNILLFVSMIGLAITVNILFGSIMNTINGERIFSDIGYRLSLGIGSGIIIGVVVIILNFKSSN